jgi:hypothetical protein
VAQRNRVGEGITSHSDDPWLNPDVNSYWMCDIGRFECPTGWGDASPPSDAAEWFGPGNGGVATRATPS